MEQNYWDMFKTTGSVKDYLSYKMEKSTEAREQSREEDRGADSHESDSVDRYGAVYGTRWRV